MKAIRYLLVIPICILFLLIVYSVFIATINWFLGLSVFGLIVTLFIFGGLIWGFFSMMAGVLMALVNKLSPGKTFGLWVVSILSILFLVGFLIEVWGLDANYSGSVLFAAIVLTLFGIELTVALIVGAFASLTTEPENMLMRQDSSEVKQGPEQLTKLDAEQPQQPKTFTIGNKEFRIEQRDGVTFIPFDGQDETQKIKDYVDTDQYEVVPIKETVPIEGVHKLAKVKTQEVVKGVEIRKLNVNKGNDDKS